MSESGSDSQRCQSSEQLLEFFRCDSIYFLSRLVTMDETWLYHYDSEIRQQSMEWWHSDSPRPQKIPSAKLLWKSSRLDFFLIKAATSLLIIFQRDKLSTRNIVRLCWCNWRTFRRKNAAGISPRGSCSCTTMLRLTGTWNPEETGLPGHPMSWSSTLFSGCVPVGLPSLPGLKNNWNIAIFRPTQRPGWKDNILNFFWVTCKT